MEEKYNYEVLFIGGVYEEGEEKEYILKSKNGIQNAVNSHQWNFIHGIDYNNLTPVQILSARYVEAYPNYKELYVKKNIWSHTQKVNDENIGFLNIKIIKNIIRSFKLKIKAKKWATSKSNKQKLIICYYPSLPQMNATIKAKSKNDNIKTVLIVPDIPMFMNLQKNLSNVKQVIQNYINKKALKMIQNFDSYVVLTEKMADALKIEKEKCIVLEGIINYNEKNYQIHLNKTNKKKIVYAGSLHEKYGLRNYIEAIKQINNNDVEFYIFGSGEMSDEIRELAKKDKRIIFMGYKDRNTVLAYQRKAYALINPRPIDEEYTQYSFPSKVMEYMVSARPVLTTKLESIPKEYYEYLYFIEDSSSKGIKEAIEQILKKDEYELINKGKLAQEFIYNNKNNRIQMKKLLDFISNMS